MELTARSRPPRKTVRLSIVILVIVLIATGAGLLYSTNSPENIARFAPVIDDGTSETRASLRDTAHGSALGSPLHPIARADTALIRDLLGQDAAAGGRNLQSRPEAAFNATMSGLDGIPASAGRAELPQALGPEKSRGADPLDDASDRATDDPEEPYLRNGLIAGRVTDESGMAIVGMGVTVTATHLASVAADATVPVSDLQRHAVSDSAGYFRFGDLVPGEYRLNNLPTESYGSRQVSVRTGGAPANLVLTGLREVQVAGTVSDTSGNPLANALVQPQGLGARAAYTDATGRFSLSLRVSRGASSLALRTQVRGYHSKNVLVVANNVNADEPAAVHIELEPLDVLTVVSGVVRDAEGGGPLPLKIVQLNSLSDRQRHVATTDVDGRFAIQAVEANQEYELRIAGGGGHSAWQQSGIALTEQGMDIDIALQPDETTPLAGRMVNLNGTPIPYQSLLLRAEVPPYQTMRVTGDDKGHFVIASPPDGPLVFESKTNPRLSVSGVRQDISRQENVTLVLDVGRNELLGRIVDAAGAPVPVPSVTVSWRHAVDGVLSSSSRQGPADSQGQFSFSGLGPGIHTIRVNAKGYAPATIEHDAARDGYEVTVRLVEAPPG